MVLVVNVRVSGQSRAVSVVVPRTFAEFETKLRKQFADAAAQRGAVMRLRREANGARIDTSLPPDRALAHKEVIDVEFVVAPDDGDDGNGADAAIDSRARAMAAVAAASSAARAKASAKGAAAAASVGQTRTNNASWAPLIVIPGDHVVAAASSSTDSASLATETPSFSPTRSLAIQRLAVVARPALPLSQHAAEDEDLSNSDYGSEEEDESALLSAFERAECDGDSDADGSDERDGCATASALGGDSLSSSAWRTASLHFLLLEPWQRQKRSSRVRLAQLGAQLAAAFDGPFTIVSPASDAHQGSGHDDHMIELRNASRFALRLYKLLLFGASAASTAATLPSLAPAQHALVVVLLCHGGFCAALACQAGRTLAHKTFHRYVVRKKQGGRQVTKDGASSKSIKSVGAAMRRHHEVRLREEIQQLLGAWRSLLHAADLIVVHAPGAANRDCVFGAAFDCALPDTALVVSAPAEATAASAAGSASAASGAAQSTGSLAHMDVSRIYTIRRHRNDGDEDDDNEYDSNRSAGHRVSSNEPRAPLSAEFVTRQNAAAARAAPGLRCVLDASDARVNSCPFAVGRATLQQALSVYRSLTTVEWRELPSPLPVPPVSSAPASAVLEAPSASATNSDNVEVVMNHSSTTESHARKPQPDL